MSLSREELERSLLADPFNGERRGEYADGCGFDFSAPAGVVIQPGHDAWVVGDGPAVLIQFDFEGETLDRLGVSEHPRHG